MMTSLSGPGRNERYLYTPQDERIATISHLAARPTFEWTLRGLDQKVLTTYESELLAFEPNQDNPVQEIQGWTWQKDYVYRGSSLLAAEVTDNVGGENREHFHLDHLGTPRLKTDEHGTELASHKYLPYGEELTDSLLDNEVMQFTAHERDRDPAGHGNDLDYMHARYYLPRLGRFLSVDPVLGKPENPQSWNRYGYVGGNPVNFVDPTGEAIVPAGDEDERVEVLGVFRRALQEAGADQVADQLVLEEVEGQVRITAGGADLSESSNSTVILIGSAINAGDTISVGLTDRALNSVGGAFTESAGTRSDPTLLRIRLNDPTISSLVLPGVVESGKMAGTTVGLTTTLATALVHELGHAYGYFSEGAIRFPVFGQTNATAIRFENAHRRLMAGGGYPVLRRLRH